MQTFFNPTTPFFDGEGHLLVGAAVSFLDTGTSGSLITIKDSDGVTLPNPLYTGSDGRMRLDNGNGAPAVPCIADGLSYKVVVARRTGVEPIYVGGILQNASELYEEPDIVFVVTAMGQTEAEDLNTTCLGSIAEVRIADKAIGTVVCSGYYSAGDCPARVFKWVDSVNPPADNAINVLRNPDDTSGYWKMSEPESGVWDVRIAGLSTTGTPELNDQCLTRLLNIVNGNGDGSRVSTIYFPKGNWLLDSGFVCGSIILETGANLKPADNTADRTVVVDRIENRGGYFWAYGNAASDKRVVPVTKGALHTSWFKGTLNEFLTQSAIVAPVEIVFDSIDRTGTANVVVENKVVRVFNGVSISNTITFSDCFVLSYDGGSLKATSFRCSSVSAGVVLDIDGLRLGDALSNVEVNHAGMVAKNSDESYTMALDFSAIEFHESRYTGTLDSQKVNFHIAEYGGATLTGTELTISSDLDYAEYNAHGIESSEPIAIEKGARLPWPKKDVNSVSPNIEDTMFANSDQIVVVATVPTGSSYFNCALNAVPTSGREIKFLSKFADVNAVGAYYINVTDSGNNSVAVVAVTSVIHIVADGSSWKVDYGRI